jgi:hypothetical protein
MSVWMKLLVAPKEPVLLGRDEFGELLRDLLRREIVMMPCAIVSADYLDATSPLSIANNFIHHRYINGEWITYPLDFPPGTHLPGTGVVHYCGESVEDLLKALSKAPYGGRDLCVWFEGLNFDNEEVRSTGSYNADVVIYVLAEPQKILYIADGPAGRAEMNRDELEDMDGEDLNIEMEACTYVVQTCFRTIGKSGPYKTCALMDAIFERYFGKDFIIDCSYS